MAKKFIDTYTLLTAENILHQLDIFLSSQQLQAILKENDAFYKKILLPVCLFITNQQINEYCGSLDDYGTAEIKRLQETYQGLLKSNQIDKLSAESTVAKIDNIRDQLSTLKFRRHKITENQTEVFNTLKQTLQKHVKDWLAMQSRHANQLTEALIADGFAIPQNFTQQLEEKLQYQALEQEDFPKEILKRLNIKNHPTLIEKALISALYGEQHGHITP